MNNAVRYRNRDYQYFAQQRSSDEECYEPAGFWLRVVASIYDNFFVSLIMGAIILVISSALSIAAGFFGPTLLRLLPHTINPSALTGPMLVTVAVLLVLQITAIICYGAVFEGSKLRATPGKLLLGLQVGDYQGDGLTLPRALRRNILKYKWMLLMYAGILLTAAALLAGGPCIVALAFALATGIVPAIVYVYETGAVAFDKHKQAKYDFAAECVVEKHPDVSFERRVLLSMIAVLFVSGIVTISYLQPHKAVFRVHAMGYKR